MPTLHVLQGADKGRTFDRIAEPVVLGRLSENVSLSDNSVSRRHAELRPQDGHWILTDLGSSNGTCLNGVRIEGPVALKDGDQIKLGGTLLVFSGDDARDSFGGPLHVGNAVQWRGPNGQMDSSILSAIPSNEDSLILAGPETADAVHAWKILYKLAEVMGSQLSVQAFLERVTDVIFDHLTADRVFVLLRDEDGEFQTRVARVRGTSRRKATKITTSRTIVSHVFEHKEGVLCEDVGSDQRFSDDAKGGSVHQLGKRSVLCVPIVAHEEVRGVIHLDTLMSRHTYSGEQLRLATTVGRMAGMAIENAQLLESRVATERLAAVGETVAHLSHYIRNILQGMRSGADVLEMGLRRENLDAIQSGWKIIQHNLDRTYQLTTNMLTFSKERQPAVELGQLNFAVEDAVALMQRRADDKGIVLMADLSEDLPAVPLDMEGMSQVAANVINNAIDAVEEQVGRISVRTLFDAENERVTLSVSDNGPGILPEQLRSIFRAFHSTKGHGGTGLGLAAAHKIMQELGGRIDVESPPGEGTTFHIHLPLRTMLAAGAAETQGPPR